MFHCVIQRDVIATVVDVTDDDDDDDDEYNNSRSPSNDRVA